MKQKNVGQGVNPGDEVWAFICRSCQSPIPVLNDLDELDAVVDLTCPKCGADHLYPKNEARRAKAHLKQ